MITRALRGITLRIVIQITSLACTTYGEEVITTKWPFFLFSSTVDDGFLFLTETQEYDAASRILKNDAYVSNRDMPPGCDCRKTGDTDHECTLFECTCICDLIAGV